MPLLASLLLFVVVGCWLLQAYSTRYSRGTVGMIIDHVHSWIRDSCSCCQRQRDLRHFQLSNFFLLSSSTHHLIQNSKKHSFILKIHRYQKVKATNLRWILDFRYQTLRLLLIQYYLSNFLLLLSRNLGNLVKVSNFKFQD